MTHESSFAASRPERVDPYRLRLVLQESGWTVAGERAGVYVRMLPPTESGHSVLVPMDRSAPEYAETMRAALTDIGRLTTREIWASDLAARLIADPTDSFHFRAESSAPRGLIFWNHGERLIRNSRRIMAAGAKTHVEHLKYYGNRLGQFASRYLDRVYMGQTIPGSYIVTAYTLANDLIPISASTQVHTAALFDAPTEAASTRGISISVMSAAEATKEAIEHYHASASLSGFERLVDRGVSYEMTTAVTALLAGSDEADISVEWDPALEPPTDAPARFIAFQPSDVEVLTRASTQLATNVELPARMTIMGRVHLLTQREAGGPGVIGVENLSATKPKKLRVHLGDDDYHVALQAHDRNDAVVVEGQIQREGNIHWVYDGRIVSVLGPIEEIAAELRATAKQSSEVRGQLELGE